MDTPGSTATGLDTEAPEGADDEPRRGPSRSLIDAAAHDRELTEEQHQDATAWFLDPEALEDDDDDDPGYPLKLNVGGPVDDDGAGTDPENPPRFIEWRIKSVDEAVITRASGAGGGAGRRRRPQQVPAGLQNARIVVAGTVNPDLTAAAAEVNKSRKAKGKPQITPEDALRLRFKKKPGLIGQIAGEILDLSGFNEADIREGRTASEVQAAQG